MRDFARSIEPVQRMSTPAPRNNQTVDELPVLDGELVEIQLQPFHHNVRLGSSECPRGGF